MSWKISLKDEQKKLLASAGFVYAVAIVLAVYGGDFSWRQALVGLVAAFLFLSGDEIRKAAFPEVPFKRVQFRITLRDVYFGEALVDAGICTPEDFRANPKWRDEILVSCPNGQITFTWLERKLFFITPGSFFNETAEIYIQLGRLSGEAREAWPRRLANEIELGVGQEGYELTLVKPEDFFNKQGSVRICLLKLPWAFFRTFLSGKDDSEQLAHRILESDTDLKYSGLEEVPSSWDYGNKYVRFRWWTL